MKILILGAKGSLGQTLEKVFEKNNEVISWDRGEVDITDKDLIAKKIKDVKPDVIINAAAFNAVDKCEIDEKEFESAKKINSDAPGYLAVAALDIGAILIHYSTDYVFEGKKKRGYKEDDEPKPISKYGETKLAGERAIISFSGKGLKWYLIRTSKLFGPKGESDMSKDSFFDIMLKLGKEKRELDIVNEEISCFTYTSDMASATNKILEENRGYGIYHITNKGTTNWSDFAAYIFKTLFLETKVKEITTYEFNRPAKRPKNSTLKSTKFDFEMRPWKKAVKDYLRKYFIVPPY